MNRFEIELTRDNKIEIRSDDNAVVQLLAMHADLDRERHLRANLYLHAFCTMAMVGVLIMFGVPHDFALVSCLASLLLRALMSEMMFRDSRRRMLDALRGFIETSGDRGWQVSRKKE